MSTREWSYTYVRRIETRAGTAELEDRLDNGWEPIGANDHGGLVTVHLRRRVQPPTPSEGRTWAECAGCGGNIFRHIGWSHEGGTPPQDHDAEPVQR